MSNHSPSPAMHPRPSREEIGAFCQAATIGNNADIMAYLDRYGSAFIDAKNKHGWTALMCAAANGNTETALLLLESGASLDETEKRGRNASVLAVDRGQPEIAALLQQWPEMQKRKEQKIRQEHDPVAAEKAKAMQSKLRSLGQPKLTLKKRP